MLSELFGLILQALSSNNAVVALLLIFLAVALVVLVWVVAQFLKSHTEFIDYLRESKADMKEQLAECERRCRDNSDQFFRMINNLAGKLE